MKGLLIAYVILMVAVFIWACRIGEAIDDEIGRDEPLRKPE